MRFAIVTSGGDSPGMNAAIETLVRRAPAHELTPLGVQDGFDGLLEGRVSLMTPQKVAGIGGSSGTVLGSARPKGLDKEEGLLALIQASRAAEIDALAILGGDGSLGYVAARLSALGMPCVGLPCTIDNDVPESDYSLGFDSASAYALVTVDAMRMTGRSLSGRVFVLETLGGRTGHLALAVAYGSHADAVAIPEVEPDWRSMGDRLSRAVEFAGHALLVLSEGVSWQFDVQNQLTPHLAHRIRWTGLGHAQRGAIPSHRERVIARDLSEAALIALAGGRTGMMLGWRNSGPIEVPLTRVAGGRRAPDLELYNLINGLKG